MMVRNLVPLIPLAAGCTSARTRVSGYTSWPRAIVSWYSTSRLVNGLCRQDATGALAMLAVIWITSFTDGSVSGPDCR